MTNTPLRIIKKRSSASEPTATQPDTSSIQESSPKNEVDTGTDRNSSPDSVELDLSTIKLPEDFQAKLEEEKTASNKVAPPPAATAVITQSVGTNIFNEIRSDFSLDRFLSLSDSEDWGTDSDLIRECEGLSEDYVDFLLSYE